MNRQHRRAAGKNRMTEVIGGTTPYAEPDPNKIYHFADPKLPQFAFEWHVKTQKCYRVDVPGVWKDGVFVQSSDQVTAVGRIIAEHVETHAAAICLVQTFLRGYILGLIMTTEDPKRHGGVIPERIAKTDSCPINK